MIHWNTVFKKMSAKGDYRKNHLTFNKQSSGSIQRYNAVKSFSLDEYFRRTTLVIGNEEAPFFFSDKIQVAHIGSLFDIDSKVLNNWNERSLLEYAKWDTRDSVELDVLTRSKNFYRIVQFGLPGGQEFSIARPLQRNGKWIVRHADKLILRTFERCYITIVCPPSIDHTQILYGKVNYDCVAVWILKHCPQSSSKNKNGTADKLSFEEMQNTKIDEQPVSDRTDVKNGESGINATLIDASNESRYSICEHQHSAVAPDLAELPAVNPHRSDAGDQTCNGKDVDMAESSKLDDAIYECQNKKSQETNQVTNRIDEEKKTDADTSKLVEVSEGHLLPDIDLQNKRNHYADDKNGADDESDPISSFSPIQESTRTGQPPLDGSTPQHKQLQVATSEVRHLASPQHTRKKTYAPQQGNQRKLEDLLFRMQISHLLSMSIFILTVTMTTMFRLLESNRVTSPSKKKCTRFNTVKCENVLAQFRQSKEKTDECLKIVKAWSSLFDNGEQQLFAKRAACYLLTFANTMCYAVTALRVLSFAPWSDKHFLGHVREIALCAIAKGWTHRNPNILVSKNRVTTADICVAISSYDNESIFPPGEVSELDQTILEVCSDLFPHHVQEFYSKFQFNCFSCQESITKNICLFDADAFQWNIPSDICLHGICTKMTPRNHFDKDGLIHKSDCCDNDAITFSQIEHGQLMIVIFRQELVNLPSVLNCCHLLHQQVELDHLRSTTCIDSQQQMPIVSRQYQCSALIVCQTSSSSNCNHFYLIEDQNNKDFQVFDNLKGCGWRKKDHVAVAKVYGIVLRTQTKKSTHFKFDPTMYQLSKLPKIANTTNKSKKKVKGICTRSYLNGISRSKQHQKRNNHAHASGQNSVSNAHRTTGPMQHCPQDRHGGSTANGSNSTDDSKRKSTEKLNGNHEEGSCKTSTKLQEAPIQSEHPEKKSQD